MKKYFQSKSNTLISLYANLSYIIDRIFYDGSFCLIDDVFVFNQISRLYFLQIGNEITFDAETQSNSKSKEVKRERLTLT